MVPKIDQHHLLKSEKNHARAKEHAQQYTRTPYTRGKRLYEMFVVSCAAVLYPVVLMQMVHHFQLAFTVGAILACFLGILGADLVTGLVHWTLDSWGSVDLPIVGTNFIRMAREHHIDPVAIISHDFIETNADHCSVTLIPLVFISYNLFTHSPEQIRDRYTLYCFILTMALLVSFTNQIHKWSHMSQGLPRWVAWLQKMHLILPRNHHHIHHVSPHEIHFCLTTGWLNYPLEFIHFWSTLEYVIEWLTGCKPRTDDYKWAYKGR